MLFDDDDVSFVSWKDMTGATGATIFRRSWVKFTRMKRYHSYRHVSMELYICI